MKPTLGRSVVRYVTYLTVVGLILLLVLSLLGGDPLVKGRQAFEDGDYVEAARLLARASDRRPGDAGILRELGKSLSLIQKYDRAAATYLKAMEIRPGDHDLVRMYGEMLVLNGEKESPPFNNAQSFARQFIRTPGNESQFLGHYLLGKALHHRFSHQKEKFFKETEKRFEGPYVWEVLGFIKHALEAADFFGAGRKELIQNLKRLVDLPPSDPLHDRVGVLRRTQDNALAALREAQTRKNHLGFPVLEEAEFLLDLNQKERAEVLSRSLIQTPGDAVRDEIRIKAQRLLAKILSQSPDSDRVRLREAARNWGAYLFGLEKLPMAYRQKSLLRFEAHNARGELFIRLKNPGDIREVAESLLEGDKNNPSGLFYQGMALYFEGNYKEAENDLTASLNKRHDFISYMTLGHILSTRGGEVNEEQAFVFFRAAGRLKPDSVEPILAEIKLYINRTHPNYVDAHTKIRQAIARNLWRGRKNEEILALRDQVEIALLKKNKNESYTAPAEAIAALKTDPRAPYPLYFLAEYWAEKDDFRTADKYADRLQKSAKKSMLAKLVYARVLLNLAGQETPDKAKQYYDKAEIVLSLAQDLDPYDVRPFAMAARVARSLGNSEKYIKRLHHALDIDPQDVESRLEITRICFGGKNFRGARYHLDIAKGGIEKPTFDLQRLDLEIKLNLGELEGAEKDILAFKDHPEASPGDFHRYRGWLAELRGNDLQAREWYIRGIEVAPGRGDLVVAAARLEMDHGDTDSAHDRLTAFRQGGGRYPEVNTMLGRILLDRWELIRAKEVFDELCSLAPRYSRGPLGSGRCAMYLGLNTENDIWSLMSQVWPLTLEKDDEKLRDLLISGIYGYLDIRLWKLALERIQDLDALLPGSPLRGRALLAFFNGDRMATRDLVEKGLESPQKDPFLRFLRALLSLQDKNLDGIIEDVGAIVPGIQPASPWKEYAFSVARKRPGFGRTVLATVAEVHLLKDRTRSAREILDVATRAYPRDARLKYLRAHVLFRTGKRDESLALLKEIENSVGMDALRDRSIILALRKEPAAVPLMERYAASHPQEGNKLLAWVRFEVGDASHTDLLMALRTPPHWRWDPTGQVLLTGLMYVVDGPERALGQIPGPDSLAGPHLQKLLMNAPTGKEALRFIHLWENLIRGLSLQHLPLFQHLAAHYLEDVLAVDPEHALFLDLVGRLQIHMGDLVSARETYERLHAEEDRTLRRLGLVRILSKQEKTRDQARKVLKAILEDQPRAPDVFVELGAVLLEMNLPHEAAGLLDRGLKTVPDPRDPRLHDCLGQALERIGDGQGARVEYASILAQNPHDRYTAYRLAKRLLASHDYIPAVALLARHPTLCGTYPDLGLFLGLTLFHNNFPKKAKSELVKFPYSARAAECLGHIYRQEGKKQEAIKQFKLAQSLDPEKHKGALLEVVEIYREEFEPKKALKEITLYLKWAPLDAEAQAIQAGLLGDLCRHDQALFHWLQTWRLDMTNATPLLKIAVIFRKKGDMKMHKIIILGLLDRWPHAMDAKTRQDIDYEKIFHRK